ncbi:MAG: hypothetical protein ACJASB_001402 [Shewanella psychromarinicola]|jgi:hypothetical protein
MRAAINNAIKKPEHQQTMIQAISTLADNMGNRWRVIAAWQGRIRLELNFS